MFGFGKKKEFFLELDDNNASQAAETATTATAAPTQPTEEVKPEPKPEPVETPTVQEAEPEAKKLSPRAKKLQLFKGKAEKQEEPKVETTTPQSVASPAVAATAPNVEVTPSEQEVYSLPVYLMPNPMPKRRPGKNMKMYQDMARQVKSSRK